MHRTVRCTLALALLAVTACASAPAGGGAGDLEARNKTLAREAYAAFARGDIPGFLAMMDANVVWHEAASLPYGGTYRGPDAILQNIFVPLGGDWDQFSATPERVIGDGAEVAVLGRYRAISKHNGKRLDVPFVHVFTFDDAGKIVQFDQMTDTALYMDALGR